MNLDSARWDKNAGEYQKVFQAGMNAYNRKLMDFLLESGMLRPGCRVLDVGCGVGKYGSYFAALGCDVTLTDISGQMLRRAEQNMSRFSTPWRTLECDFNTADPESEAFAGGFDLSISTMSPAIHDLATVEKLSSVTRGACFITSFTSWKQPLRDSFYMALNLPPEQAMAGQAGQLCQLVSRAGYQPKTRVVPYNWQDDRSPEQAAEYLLKRHSAADEADGELMGRAIAVARGLCGKDGLFRDAVFTEVQWLWWECGKEK